MSLDLNQLLDDFDQTAAASLTENTKRRYKSHYDAYCEVISQINGLDPEPIDEMKLKAFLSFRKQSGKSYTVVQSQQIQLQFPITA